MNIALELLHGIAICKNPGSIPITDDPLILSICSKHYICDDLFVTAINNGNTIVFEAVDGIAVIPQALKKPGELQIVIQKIVNGEILNTWNAEKILLKSIGGEISAIPQITALTEKVAALTEAVAELKKIITESEEF